MKKFTNLAYGDCILIAESEDLYLIHAPKAAEPYIVCTYMDEMGTLMGQKFFRNVFEANNFYTSKLEEKTKQSSK